MLNCPWARGAWRISLVTVFFIASSDRKKSNTSLFSSLLYITPIRSLVRGFVARLAWFVEISSFMRAFAAFCCMSRDLCRENSNHFVSIHFHLNFDRKFTRFGAYRIPQMLLSLTFAVLCTWRLGKENLQQRRMMYFCFYFSYIVLHRLARAVSLRNCLPILVFILCNQTPR